ncbi:hypothetical protein F5887DRAFT_1079836 [Amanita rubescens]|nr:hypothetical protein F5887DRAFT_1079836 [Amanita rubescens]
MGKRRRDKIEYYDDVVLSTSKSVIASPAPVQHIQRHTEISSRDATTSTVKTNQIYYSVTGPPLQQCPSQVVHEIQWSTQPMPDGIESVFDEPINFVNPPTAVAELEIMDDNRRANRYLGDFPLLTWIPEIDTFVSEFLRLEGRGAQQQQTCASCLSSNGDELRLYRCDDCHDMRLLCRSCIVMVHRVNPLHRLWNGEYFESTSLKALGLVIQLNHNIDDPCLSPALAFNGDFVILDSHGIHSVTMQYCNCHQAVSRPVQLLRSRLFPATTLDPKTAATFRLLEAFQLLSFTSKVSAFEYYQSISRQSDNTGTCPPPDRYRAFMRIIREWHHIRLLKRTGRGHDPTGVAGTREGECALLCPACPQPGKNLPDDWQIAPEKKQWLYALFVGIDANFRLKRLNISNNTRDPSLNHGYAYIVDEGKFNDHLAKFGNHVQNDTSRCNNHDAIKSASMRGGKGTAATGIGTVECVRHDMKRPVSLGDLQKGERYINMDYFFLSSMRQGAPTRLIVSYDIACQWSKRLGERCALYGTEAVALLSQYQIQYLVPKFHLPAHIPHCQAHYSFNFTPHVGRTDGEAPERGWSAINAVANSTKQMGPGSRRDTLDDHFGDYNWRKIASIATFLSRKVTDAIKEREIHVVDFKEFNSAFRSADTKQWLDSVLEWERDRTKPNPFETTQPSISEAKVRLQLAEEEKKAQELGQKSLHEEVSGSLLIWQGLDIEEQQYRLKADTDNLGQHATDNQRAAVLERANRLRRRIDAWSEIQHLYMPGVALLCAKEDKEGGGKALDATSLSLFLPSQIIGCADCNQILFEFEWRLRFAQAHDALNEICRLLVVRSRLHRSKQRFARGQAHNTRSMSVLNQLNEKINFSVKRYRDTRVLLERLARRLLKVGWEHQLRPLADEDIRPLEEGDSHSSEGRRTLSWIWRIQGTIIKEEATQEALRVEWCKARARANRWQEECLLLEEEMARVLRYFAWQAGWWKDIANRMVSARGSFGNSSDSATAEGRRAYALRQSSLQVALKEHCKQAWDGLDEKLKKGEGAAKDINDLAV